MRPWLLGSIACWAEDVVKHDLIRSVDGHWLASLAVEGFKHDKAHSKSKGDRTPKREPRDHPVDVAKQITSF